MVVIITLVVINLGLITLISMRVSLVKKLPFVDLLKDILYTEVRLILFHGIECLKGNILVTKYQFSVTFRSEVMNF